MRTLSLGSKAGFLLLAGCTGKFPDDFDKDYSSSGSDPFACDRLEPSDRLDLEAGCADGLCADTHTLDDFIAALGEPHACAESSTGEGTYCDWSAGLEAFFDSTADEIPGETVARFFALERPYDGTDPDGLGVGLSMDCFIEILGPPRDQGDYDGNIFYATWSEPSITAWDSGDSIDEDDPLPDGFVERLVLY